MGGSPTQSLLQVGSLSTVDDCVHEQRSMLTAISLGDCGLRDSAAAVFFRHLSAAPFPGLSAASGAPVVASQSVQAASSGMVWGVPVCRWLGDGVLADGKFLSVVKLTLPAGVVSVGCNG